MRVWVTRDEPASGPLCTALSSAGLTPVHEPVLTRRIVDDADKVISRLGAGDWLVLTSPFAVEAVAHDPARVPCVAVVGEASLRAAKTRGFRVELVSGGSDAKSLFEELRVRTAFGKVCYPRSSLVAAPEAWGQVEILSPVLYETCPRSFDQTVIDRTDTVAVASPSAVDAIRATGASLRGLSFASIGPTTSAALHRVGIEPWVEAPTRSFESLAQAIANQTGDSRHQRA